MYNANVIYLGNHGSALRLKPFTFSYRNSIIQLNKYNLELVSIKFREGERKHKREEILRTIFHV